MAKAYKPIAISDIEATQKFISDVEGRASTRLVTAADLEKIAAEAEKCLSALPKKMWTGARVEFRGEGPWASSYGYKAGSTRVVLVRRSADWALVEAERVSIRPKQARKFLVTIPSTVTRDELADRMLAHNGLQLADSAA